ncbi:hypothetical protein HK104_000291 [Borealophlyctis nickersoniae]|nr:hypothetical protein HK104_000291 [Borealophlyctis nickersoniae]
MDSFEDELEELIDYFSARSASREYIHVDMRWTVVVLARQTLQRLRTAETREDTLRGNVQALTETLAEYNDHQERLEEDLQEARRAKEEAKQRVDQVAAAEADKKIVTYENRLRQAAEAHHKLEASLAARSAELVKVAKAVSTIGMSVAEAARDSPVTMEALIRGFRSAGFTLTAGGSVVRALKNHPDYSIRALTRDPTKPAAQALAAEGIEVVKGDVSNKEDVRKAFEGAYGVFAVTDYWGRRIEKKEDGDFEVEQGRVMVDVAKELKTPHFIYSSLPDAAALTSNKITTMHHYQNKHAVQTYAHQNLPTTSTFVYPGYYNSNFAAYGWVHKDGDGTVVFTLPMDYGHLPLVDLETDLGRAVVRLFELGPDATAGKVYAIMEGLVPIRDIPKTFTAVTDIPSRYEPMDDSVFLERMEKAVGKTGAEDLLAMFKLYQDYGFAEEEAMENGRRLGIEYTSFGDWVQKTKFMQG